MTERVSASQRLKAQNVAERHVMKYAGDHALWHKYIHDVELDSVQILKMKEMDEHPNTIDFASRRTGKTVGKELYNLEYNACNKDQELGIVSPREAQSIVNLNYHLERIRHSPILTAYIGFRSGRRQFSDTKYEFYNRSKAQAYGIMSQVDGGDLTVASLEEVDDMPKDRLFSRFLLMLAATRRLGSSTESKNDPQIRITGVFKGADTLTDLLRSGSYHAIGSYQGERARVEIRKLIAAGWIDEGAVEVDSYDYPLPVLNAVNAMALGLLNEQFILNMRDDLGEDEFIRQLLCINTSSRNLVWETYLRRAMQVGLESGLELANPLPGLTYKKRGLVSFGYDHEGHGETPQASKSALVVLEQIGSFTVPIFCKQWQPGADERIIENDLIGLWRYFMPDCAIGDAYGIGLLTQVNERLYNEGLTTVDRRTIGDGDSTASTWPEWAFAPLRFEGMQKHSMAQAVRSSFHSAQAAIPYFDDYDLKDPDLALLRLLCKQITNIKPVPTSLNYASYQMANPKLGDDLFDAYLAANWALVTRGAIMVPTVITSIKKTREQLLGQQVPLKHSA